MLKIIEFKVTQTHRIQRVPDPAEAPEPNEETPWGTLVGLGAPDPDLPYGAEVSVILKYGDAASALVQEFLDKMQEMEQTLTEEAGEKTIENE